MADARAVGVRGGFPALCRLDRLLQRRIGVGHFRLLAGLFENLFGQVIGVGQIGLLPCGIQCHGGIETGLNKLCPRLARKIGHRVAFEAVNPACPHVHRQIGPGARGPDAPADPVARLQHRHLCPGGGQIAGSRQAGKTCPNNDDGLVLGLPEGGRGKKGGKAGHKAAAGHGHAGNFLNRAQDFDHILSRSVLKSRINLQG